MFSHDFWHEGVELAKNGWTIGERGTLELSIIKGPDYTWRRMGQTMREGSTRVATSSANRRTYFLMGTSNHVRIKIGN